jgi:hypothetical protein
MDYLKDVLYIFSLFYRLSTKKKRQAFTVDVMEKFNLKGYQI